MSPSATRSWVYPVNQVVTESATTVTASVAAAGGQGYVLGADSIYASALTATGFTTTPTVTAASVYAPASYTAQTASVATVVQNTTGQDCQFVAYFQGAASVATFQIGVGSTPSPSPVTVATSVTSSSIASYDFPAWVPAGYYFSFQAIQANAASVPSAALTIMAYPI